MKLDTGISRPVSFECAATKMLIALPVLYVIYNDVVYIHTNYVFLAVYGAIRMRNIGCFIASIYILFGFAP